MELATDYTFYCQLGGTDYGTITVPKGTTVTHDTAMGRDEKYHFVSDFSWIDKNYPEIDNILKHDARFYGIDVPAELILKN